MKRWLYATLLFFLLGTVPFARAAERPPANLHQVAGHWTAWDPPRDFPEGTKIYTIAPGDTLWDLAAQFFGDPYLWPQLWESNRYILDAHWIYPGDPLVIGAEVTEIESLDSLDLEGDGDGADGDGDLGRTGGRAGSAPVPLGSESDIYCSGFVGGMREVFPFQIIGSEHEALQPRLYIGDKKRKERGRWGAVDTAKYAMATSDIVYVDGGRTAGLQPGDEFTVVAPGERVLHPQSGEVYGRFYSYDGRVRILSVQENTAIAEISHACNGVVVGSQLVPFEPEPVPLARRTQMRPPNLPSPASSLAGAPVILQAQDDVVSLGQDHVVYLDRGADAMTPGEIYTIYRLHENGMPAVVLGELAVLSVHPRSAVAKIINSRYTIYVGDLLERK